MILGIGTDVSITERFVENTDKLSEKILTAYELIEFTTSKNKPLYLAKKWACKEAISKAFGSGISGDVTWKNIEIQHDRMGKPIIMFKGKLKQTVDELEIKSHLSISDTNQIVVAYCVLEY